MGLLFPLYLLAGLAIAIPIALHLRRRPPKDRTVFSSLMFLEAQPPQKKSRNKVENLLLLALRCLALLLLALLFSRPFVRDRDALAELAQGSVQLILLDQSASMQRNGLWDAALQQLDLLLAETSPADRVEVLGFDAETQQITSFQQWKESPAPARRAMVLAALDEEKPSWNATALDAALMEGVGRVEDEARNERVKREIILISDLQDGASRGGLENFAWPEDLTLRPVRVASLVQDNAAAHLVARDPDAEEDADEEAEVARRIRVTNSSESESEAFTLAWEGDASGAVDVLLPPGATRVIPAPPRSDSAGGFLELKGDGQSFDNRVFVAPPQARPVTVLHLGESAEDVGTDSPLFYLQRALSPTEALAPTVLATTPDLVSEADIRDTDALVLSTAPNDSAIPWIRSFLSDGGLVLLNLWSNADLESLTGIADLEIQEAEVNDYAMLEQIDFEHPVLRSFANAGVRDFTRIHFWKYRQVTLPDPFPEGTHVLASFDTGDPAIVEFRQDRGRIFVFSSRWVPTDGQLALSSKFVPLLYSMLEDAGFDSDARRQFAVGDALPINDELTEVLHPDGTRSTGPMEAEEPGIYTLFLDGQKNAVAVNLPFEESRLAALEPSTFEEYGMSLPKDANLPVGIEDPEVEDELRLENSELEERQKVWKWLLLVVLFILLGETWLANRPERAVAAG